MKSLTGYPMEFLEELTVEKFRTKLEALLTDNKEYLGIMNPTDILNALNNPNQLFGEYIFKKSLGTLYCVRYDLRTPNQEPLAEMRIVWQTKEAFIKQFESCGQKSICCGAPIGRPGII